MKPITANWKHFYQGRAFFFMYAVLAIIALMIAFVRVPEGIGAPATVRNQLAYLIVMFGLGLLVATQQTFILHKPFSFCLPGHRAIPRRFVFQVGILASLLLVALFFLSPAHARQMNPKFLATALSAGVLFYLLAVWIFLGRTITMDGLLVGVFLVMGGLLFGVFLVTEVPTALPYFARKIDFDLGEFMRNTFTHPLYFFGPICLVFAALLWWRYGQVNLGRKVLNAKKGFIGESKIFTKLMFMLKPLDLFFRWQMLRSAPLSASRYAWGTLRTSHLVSPQAVDNVIILLCTPLALFFGIISGNPVANFPYFFACNLVVFVEVFPFSVPLLPTGRRERFGGILLTGAITGAIIFLYTLMLIGLSRLMAGVMTSLEITHKGLPLIPLDHRLVLLPVMASAVWFTIQLAFGNSSLKHLALIISTLAFGCILFLPEVANLIPTYMFFVSTACAWVLFIAAAYYRFFTRDLEYKRSRTDI